MEEVVAAAAASWVEEDEATASELELAAAVAVAETTGRSEPVKTDKVAVSLASV